MKEMYLFMSTMGIAFVSVLLSLYIVLSIFF
jgi:hypothetical protein